MKFVNRIMAFFHPPIEESRKKAEKYLRQEGVLGVATGNKIKAGCITNTRAITFIVKEKLPETRLMSTEVLPKKIDGYETDVIEVGGDIIPMFRKKHRPVQGGISGMTEGLSACTLGLIVFKDGKPHALTNQHCVTSSDLKADNIGKKWLQPSPIDGGKAPDAIGIIENPNCLKENEVNPIDSHIVPLSASHELSVYKYGSYPKRWVEPKIGMRFTKVGRTTGKTHGVITHINSAALVRYGDKTLKFYPCFFAIQDNWNIVNGGDSGSVVLCEGGVLGQTFAAGPNLAIFLYGTVIARELGISLTPPREGFIALGNWMNFNGTEIVLRAPTNFRSSSGISDNVIEVLPVNTRLTILEGGKIQDGYLWIKVDAREN